MLNTAVLEYKVINLIPISLAKTGIGVAIVVFSSFLNAELAFIGWRPDMIAFIIGSTAIFELIRLLFARMSDKYNKSKPFFVVGFLLGGAGIALIPEFMLPANNVLMVIPMILFYMGSAIMSTLIDSHLTSISTSDDRTNIATAIQLTRLSGYAIGGILGALLFGNRGTVDELDFARDFFTSFTYIILLIFVITGLSTLITMNDKKRVLDTSSEFSFSGLMEDILSSTSKWMLLFLFLFPIGLFMQDQILEPYSIIRLNFDAKGIRNLVSIWASLTFIFAPIGNVMAKKSSKLRILIIGQTLGSLGLLGIAGAGLYLEANLLYLGVVLFGIGSGIFSVIGYTYMMDIASLHSRNLTILLAVFGMMITFSRSISATLAAIILNLTNNNFEVVFILEAIFFISSILPIMKIERIASNIEKN